MRAAVCAITLAMALVLAPPALAYQTLEKYYGHYSSDDTHRSDMAIGYLFGLADAYALEAAVRSGVEGGCAKWEDEWLIPSRFARYIELNNLLETQPKARTAEVFREMFLPLLECE